MKKRFMSMLMAVCMVFTMFPSVAFAEGSGVTIDTNSVTEGIPLCENHKEHDTNCGYVQMVEGSPCTHECELCKDVPPALLSTPRGAITGNGYNYDPTTTTLTIDSNKGTTAWSSNQSITKADVTKVVIESGVTEIGDNAFNECTKLASVTIPSGVSTINLGAFWHCTSLASVTIPSSVTAIGNAAFSGCTKLDSVTFAEGSQLTTIGENAFYDCTSLPSVTIPSGVTTIGENAFMYCTELASVTFEGTSQLETIGESAFYDCTKLDSVTIPEGVTTIGDSAFSGCTKLDSVTFEGTSQLATIGKRAFEGCTSLASVTIPSGVTTIDDDAFSGCTSLASVTFEDANPPTTFGSSVFYGTTSGFRIYVPTADAVTAYKNVDNLATYQSKIVAKSDYRYDSDSKTLTIDSNEGTTTWRSDSNITIANVTTVVMTAAVTTIGNEAFYGCTNLASVTIPEGVTSLGDFAFSSCTSLDSVTIPSDVTTIGNSAFYACTSLASVTFEGATPPTTFGTSVFENTASGLKIYVPLANVQAYKTGTTSAYADKIVGPITGEGYSYDPTSKTLTITSNAATTAWRENTSITKANVTTVVMTAAVTAIGDYAFHNCTSLTSVTIPDGVTSIGSTAFRDCTSLANVIISEDVTTILGAAFYGCTNLASVTIPEDVTKIGSSAFQGCTNLASVTFEGATPPTTLEAGVFTGTHADLKIYVPKNSVQTYKNVGNLATWEHKIEAKSELITGQGYSYDPDTTTLTITSDAATTAWRDNTSIPKANITKVEIKEGVATIGNSAFSDCTSLESVTIPEDVTDIGDYAFYSCNLTSVTIPASVTSIGDNAFYRCSNLASVTFLGATPPTTFGSQVFEVTAITLKIYVPTASVQTYKTGTTRDYADKIVARTGKKWDVRDIRVGTMLSPGDLLDRDICTGAIGVDFMAGLDYYGQTWGGFNGTGYNPLYTYEKALEDSVTTPIPEGTRFICWKVTGMEGECSDRLCPLLGEDHGVHSIVVEAVYEPISAGSHTVTLNANGGSVSPTSLTVTAGNTATLPTPSRSGSYRFDGWFTAASGGTQYTNSTPIDSNVTLYAHWTYTGGGSSGGNGGGGDGGDSTPIVTPPASNKPDTPTPGQVKVESKTDTKGNTTIAVTDKNITDAIAKAEADAKKNGNIENGITIVLSATGNKDAQSVTVNLPKSVQDTIINKKVVNTIVALDSLDMQIDMNLKAMAEINRQAKSSVSISAKRLNNANLTGTAKAAIGSRPVFNFGVYYGNGKQVQNFGSGNVSVSLSYTLGQNEKAGNVYGVYADSKGKAQWLTNSVYDSTSKVLRFRTNHFSTYGIGYKQDAPEFTDIANHWAKSDIEYVVSRGLLTGTTTFSPNTAMTRGMFVTALGRLANADVSSYKTSSFSDVKANSYYMGYIEWANKNGIAKGNNGKFMPEQSITREEMAVIMQNYAKAIGFTLPMVHHEKAFADSAKISGYAKDSVKVMQMAGVLSSKNGNLFDPKGTATRAEVSAVLRRFVELGISIDTAQGWTTNDSGKWMYYENGRPVTGKKSIGGVNYTFDKNGEMTDAPKNLKYTTHTVANNESWGLIAMKYGCSATELAKANNKKVSDIIHPGTVLKVPQK